ncbi:MAG TPA: site-2 protease family protein [Longimicrobiales bacterium]
MRSFRLGSALGIEIRIDPSWFIIFFLILWTFSRTVFPLDYPGMAWWTYYAMGLVGALLFFSSLLAHELSHSVVARRRGVPVEGITLFIFGGMARTRMESRSPGEEFVIAGVGPLSSVLIGLVFGAVWWLGDRLGWTPAVTGVAAYLGFLNVMLAAFNLLPGFPLDGGRLLRSAVWKATGSVGKATRVASIGGAIVAAAAVGGGLWQAYRGEVLNGLWLALIGWFLLNAARSSYRQFAVVHALESVPALEAMTRWPETVPPDLPLQQLVAEHFLRRHFHAYPVVAADGRALGLVTQEQVRAVPESEWRVRAVADVMTPVRPALEVRPDESMARVLDRLTVAGGGRLLVVRDGRLEGIITPADVAGWLKRAQQLKRI